MTRLLRHGLVMTTSALAAAAAGARYEKYDDDPIEALTRAFEAHNEAITTRLDSIEQQQGRIIPAAFRGLPSNFVDTGRRDQRGRPIFGPREEAETTLSADRQRDLRRGQPPVTMAERNFVEQLNSGGSGGDGLPVEEQHAAITEYVRQASIRGFADNADLEIFSNSVGSNPDGGYLVAPQLSDVIQRRVFDVSPLARLARRVQITSGDAFEEPLDTGDIEAVWVGEKEARPELDTSTLDYLRVPVDEIYTLQPVTQRLIDDSRFNIAAWLEGKIADKFAREEGQAYVNGNGVKKPLGLLSAAHSLGKDGERANYFTVQHINTGVGGGFALANAGTGVSPGDVLIDTVYSLRAPYRANARWLMNLATAAVVRKMKDSEGRFIWADAREGQPATLLGFPVELDEEMPDIEADSLSIAFGDFRQAYIIVEKVGIRMLADPYSNKPYVLFYAYRRVGGQVQNGEAVKFVRFAANG